MCTEKKIKGCIKLAQLKVEPLKQLLLSDSDINDNHKYVAWLFLNEMNHDLTENVPFITC